MRFLQECGADIEAPTIRGDTPLMVAAYAGASNSVRFLIASGANVEAPNTLGETPMGAALHQGNQDVLRFMTQRRRQQNAQQGCAFAQRPFGR